MTTLGINLKAPVFSRLGELRWLDALPGESFAPRVSGADTGGALSITEALVTPMSGPPLHLHNNTDEWIYVLEGRVEFICGGTKFAGGPGDLVAIPRGMPHAFRNFSGKTARLMGVFAPAGFELLLLDMQGRDPAEFAQRAAQYGLEIVGPQIEEPSATYQPSDFG
jgi:mannose-6-phosphate isomerase-like protein (cupin superfamily)